MVPALGTRAQALRRCQAVRLAPNSQFSPVTKLGTTRSSGTHATVKVLHYEDLESLKAHVLAFVAAYNFTKHLKALRWRTPFEATWTNNPSAFKINPHHLSPRPNT